MPAHLRYCQPMIQKPPVYCINCYAPSNSDIPHNTVVMRNTNSKCKWYPHTKKKNCGITNPGFTLVKPSSYRQNPPAPTVARPAKCSSSPSSTSLILLLLNAGNFREWSISSLVIIIIPFIPPLPSIPYVKRTSKSKYVPLYHWNSGLFPLKMVIFPSIHSLMAKRNSWATWAPGPTTCWPRLGRSTPCRWPFEAPSRLRCRDAPTIRKKSLVHPIASIYQNIQYIFNIYIYIL